MALDSKYVVKHKSMLRDTRPVLTRFAASLEKPDHSFVVLLMLALGINFNDSVLAWADLLVVFGLLFTLWLSLRDRTLSFKMPIGTKQKDPRSKNSVPEGIMYLGNTENRDEVWFGNSDARTHILYLGTTGSG
jgi:intracellular multiplication protein IcmO